MEQLRELQQRGRPEQVLEAVEGLVEKDARSPAYAVLTAACLALVGRNDDSVRLLDSLSLSDAEMDQETALDHALALFLNQRQEQARELLFALAAQPGAPGLAYSRLGTVLVAMDCMDPALRAFEAAVERDPGRAEFHSNLGSLYLEERRLEQALGHFERALRLRPELMPATRGRTACLLGLERLEETLESLQRDVDEDPDNVVKALALARMLSLSDKLRDAESVYRRVIDLEPDNLHHQMELADLFERQDRYPAILHLLPAPEGVHPPAQAGMVACRKAQAFLELGHATEARRMIDLAEELAGETLDVLVARSSLLVAESRFTDAVSELQRALETAPGSPRILSQMGSACMWTGDFERAADCFEHAAQINPMVLAGMVNAHRFPTDHKTLETMHQLADNPLIISESRAAMHFALARMLDKREQLDEAFAHLDKANALARRSIEFDPDAFTSLVDAIIHIFTPELLNRLMATGVNHRRPIFVVGLPRSGTTLTEQMLSTHPDVFGAGELTGMPAIQIRLPHVLNTHARFPACMHRMTAKAQNHAAAYYLAQLSRLDDTALRVVDKLPHNFIRIGLIRAIFPEAAIVHIRRDIRDVALSSYFQNFKAKGTGLGYAFDLEHMARQATDYFRLMEHWRSVLPDGFFEIDYEDLVAAPEETMRGVLDHLELDWNDAVLEHSRTKRPVMTASAWQARQPVYTSSKERWRRYEKQLAPFLDALPRFGPRQG